MFSALTIAGSDSSGGAGMQADLKAFTALGVHGASVVTCITSQNTLGVRDIYPLPVHAVEKQMEAVLEDLQIGAAKTGMLYSGKIAETVAKRLSEEAFPVVVDPVMVAGAGDSLSSCDLLDVLLDKLIPAATLITPNRAEAESLVGFRIRSTEEMRKACEYLAEKGAGAVLLKGGHFEEEGLASDLLYLEGEFITFESPRIEAVGHGGGCTLSAYITALLAKGMKIEQAVGEAKRYIWQAFSTGYRPGKGVDVVRSAAPLEIEAQKYDVIISLRRAITELESILTHEWVPEVGINFVYALPSATRISEVCGLEGRIIRVGSRIQHLGCVDFGVSQHVASIVLTAMHFDRDVRSALNLRFSDENLEVLQRSGLLVGDFDRADEPGTKRTMEWGTEKAISKLGKVPDAIYDRGGVGKEPMIRILGRNPKDVLEKVKTILREAKKH